MQYNFDEVIDRSGTNSTKWDKATLEEKFDEPNALPFWVADMDFKAAQPIIDAIIERTEHGIFGYSTRTDSYYDAIINWTKKRFGWEIDKRWIEYTPGVVPAINFFVQAYCEIGDKVLIQQPVYYPFSDAIKNNGCSLVNSELIYNGETYEIDFQDFERKAKDPKVKMFILCNPHNPISRVWKKKELIKLGKICIENNILVISDEIHNDLIYPKYKHIMFASISNEFALNSITCTAPSKTFNLAGLQASNIIIPNKKIMEEFREILLKNNIGAQSPLSMTALEAAYNYGEEWLEQLLEYLEGNISFIKEYLKIHLPKAKLIEPQATYLGWIDLREYESNGEKLEKTIIEKGKVAFDGGTWFGSGGAGFMRINYACPRVLLEEGLQRLCKSLNEIK